MRVFYLELPFLYSSVEKLYFCHAKLYLVGQFLCHYLKLSWIMTASETEAQNSVSANKEVVRWPQAARRLRILTHMYIL